VTRRQQSSALKKKDLAAATGQAALFLRTSPRWKHLRSDALFTPQVVATQWLGPMKEFTSYRANQILSRNGSPFWQDESYDHLVKSDVEFQRIRRYIEHNPIKAGLVAIAAQFRWSSASQTEAA
jgi:hypothetical protein